MLVLCYICPPLAVLLMGKPFSAVLNVFLTGLLFWIPGIKHALIVYAEWVADKKIGKVVDAINHPAYVKAGAGQGGGTVIHNHIHTGTSGPVNSPHVGENGTVFRRR